MKEAKILALGSAVELNKESGVYIIISRGFRKENGQLLVGYAGVPHPYGQNHKYKSRVFSSEAITKILHSGYEDESDRSFLNQQRQQATEANMANNRHVDEKTSASDQKLNKKVELTMSGEITNNEFDPFYRLKNK